MAQNQVSDDHALHFLASEGYLPLALADQPGMVEAYARLFAQTTKFFNLPASSPEKTDHQAASGAAASEEGYSHIPDEKSIMTVKTSARCPASLQPALQTAWGLTGAFMAKVTTAIARTLDLHPDVFSPFVDPCTALPPTERTPTLVRMFRYDRPPPRGGAGAGAAAPAEPKVNAEKHKDLGMLSLVVGHSPGLQALDSETGAWVSVEDERNLPPGSVTRSGGLTATLLSGETLAFLSRGRYKAGVHRVVCAPSSSPSSSSPSSSSGGSDENENESDAYRFSIVYTLRAAPAPLFTKEFESRVVGQFEPGERVEGQSSAVMFERIMRTHWNVNAAPSVREEQRRRFQGKDGNGGQGVASREERASG